MSINSENQINDLLVMCDGVAYEFYEDELFKGYVPAPFPTKESVSLEWKGKKMSPELWAQICAFMRDSHKKFNSETLIYLLYNMDDHVWDAWAPPQTTSGMAVETDETNPLWAQQREQWGEGWQIAGSVHHHCDLPAFASGQDDEDELDKDGFHVTLGNLNSSALTTDTRLTYSRCKYSTNLFDFVCDKAIKTELLTTLAGSMLHISALNDIRTMLLANHYDPSYPDYWMTNVSKPAVKTYGWQAKNYGHNNLLNKNKKKNSVKTENEKIEELLTKEEEEDLIEWDLDGYTY